MNDLTEDKLKSLDDETWARIHGKRAGRRGQPHTDNPYESPSVLHTLWLTSWRQARRERN